MLQGLFEHHIVNLASLWYAFAELKLVRWNSLGELLQNLSVQVGSASTLLLLLVTEMRVHVINHRVSALGVTKVPLGGDIFLSIALSNCPGKLL